eukprot:TRINITY_DN10718_c0_g1_i1.p1 TRINITY_DN10718_c0_g1~~TRINITY_DN10718_c0_g1_i1.p1  ORF type:complete len:549 (+),score=163.66 TRINITY_DN10718_c0_g1_i1:156-1802(+)
MQFQRHYTALQRSPINKWRIVAAAVLLLIGLSIFINMRFLISKTQQNNPNNVNSNKIEESRAEDSSVKKVELKSSLANLEAKKAELKKRLEEAAKDVREVTGRKRDQNKKLVTQNEVKIRKRNATEEEPDYEDYKNAEDEEGYKDYEEYAESDDYDEEYGNDEDNRVEEDERMNSKDPYAIIPDSDFFKKVDRVTKVKLQAGLKPVPYKEVPLILWYNPVSSFLGRHMLSPATPCPKLCEFTEQVSQLGKALVVVFHVPTSAPPIKKAFQHAYSSFSMESLAYYPGLEEWRNRVDWEMSYRYSVADVWTPYFGKGTPLREPPSPKTAKALASMFISNCGSRNNREGYYKELMKYIQVDSYGRCVHNVEGTNWPDKLDVIKNYKFYLAFENSNTPDYVTEKVYHGLRAGTVPIYMGAPNVDTFVPPNSIIKVDDFKSPKELADYLMELDKDDEKYNKYLEWKTGDWGEFETVRDKTALDARCRICIKAHALSAVMYPEETAAAEKMKLEEKGGDDAIDESTKGEEEKSTKKPPAVVNKKEAAAKPPPKK